MRIMQANTRVVNPRQLVKAIEKWLLDQTPNYGKEVFTTAVNEISFSIGAHRYDLLFIYWIFDQEDTQSIL